MVSQIGKHQITGRITGRITGQITRRITGWFTGRITERITKCKRKDAFLWKVGSLLKENDAKEKRRQNAFFMKVEEMSRVGSRDRHAWWRSNKQPFTYKEVNLCHFLIKMKIRWYVELVLWFRPEQDIGIMQEARRYRKWPKYFIFTCGYAQIKFSNIPKRGRKMEEGAWLFDGTKMIMLWVHTTYVLFGGA